MSITYKMTKDLLKRCIAAKEGGAPFPKIYEQIIKADQLFAGSLRSATDGVRIWLEVPLRSRGRLIYDSVQDELRLETTHQSAPIVDRDGRNR